MSIESSESRGGESFFFSAQTNKGKRPTLRKKLAGTWRGGGKAATTCWNYSFAWTVGRGITRSDRERDFCRKGGEIRVRHRKDHGADHRIGHIIPSSLGPPRPIARPSFVHRPSDQIGRPSPRIPGWAPHVFVLCAWTRSLCLFSLTPQTQGPRRRMVGIQVIPLP